LEAPRAASQSRGGDPSFLKKKKKKKKKKKDTRSLSEASVVRVHGRVCEGDQEIHRLSKGGPKKGGEVDEPGKKQALHEVLFEVRVKKRKRGKIYK